MILVNILFQDENNLCDRYDPAPGKKYRIRIRMRQAKNHQIRFLIPDIYITYIGKSAQMSFSLKQFSTGLFRITRMEYVEEGDKKM